jgi:hypothetical protein
MAYYKYISLRNCVILRTRLIYLKFRGQWLTLVDMTLNILVAQKAESSLARWAIISFPEMSKCKKLLLSSSIKY